MSLEQINEIRTEIPGYIPTNDEHDYWAGKTWREPKYYQALQAVFDVGGFQALTRREWVEINHHWARERSNGDEAEYVRILTSESSNIYYWHVRA